MKLANIPKIENFPEFPIRPTMQWEDATLEELEQQNTSSSDSSYLYPGYVVAFPHYLSQLILKKIIVKQEGRVHTKYVMNVLRNGKPGWVNISYLNFRDINGAAVHPISNYLAECDNDAERVLTMLGQVVVLGTAECEFKTDNGEQCKRTKAIFARMLTDYKGYKIW